MAAAPSEITPELRLDRPVDLASRDLPADHKEAWYARLRDELPGRRTDGSAS